MMVENYTDRNVRAPLRYGQECPCSVLFVADYHGAAGLEEGGGEGEGVFDFFLPVLQGLDALLGVGFVGGKALAEGFEAFFAVAEFGAEMGVEKVAEESAHGEFGGVKAVALAGREFPVHGAEGLEEFESLAGGSGADAESVADFLLEHRRFGAVEGAIDHGGGFGQSEGFENSHEQVQHFQFPWGNFGGLHISGGAHF